MEAVNRLGPDVFQHLARAAAVEGAQMQREESPPPNIFASPPAKRFKLNNHELVPLKSPEPLLPRYLVSRQALDVQGAPHMHYGELEMHELTVRNHEDKLMIVMADCAFSHDENILYYEIETKSESFVASMGIERRYVGLELIGGAARDTAAIAQAELAAHPFDPAIDIRADVRYPLALKSRFLQDPLNGYNWVVRMHRLWGSDKPALTPSSTSHAWHRIGVLLDRSNNTLSATRDGLIVATTTVGNEVNRLNGEIGLLPVFALAKHGIARAIFGDPELENYGFKFDLDGYIKQRQREVAEMVNSQVPPQVPLDMFSAYFQYYGYAKAAQACYPDRRLRPSVATREKLRKAILSGNCRQVPEIWQSDVEPPASAELLRAVEGLAAQEIAHKHLCCHTAPDAEEMKKITTSQAAALLITSRKEFRTAVTRHLKDREQLLEQVLDEYTRLCNENFNSPTFPGTRPVLSNLSKSFTDNIYAKAPQKNGTCSLLYGYLEQQFGDEFEG